MNKQLKNKWVAALRSGRYKQTTGALRTKNGDGQIAYCCLGVLCNIASDKKWKQGDMTNFGNEKIWGLFDPNPRDYIDDGNLEVSHIPTDLTDKFGLDIDAQKELDNLNDEARYDFNQIADWVMENL